MNKKLAVTWSAISLTSLSALGATAMSKPNIVFILVDDLGWSDLGCYGNTFNETPNIDKLASEGIRFTSAYAMPTSSPSRASLMTGMNPTKTGIYAVNAFAGTPIQMQKVKSIKNNNILLPQFTTIAEVLKSAGYVTGHFGKWHLGNTPETFPTNQGFDVNVAGCDAGHPDHYFAPYGNIKNLDEQQEGTYITDAIMPKALDFLESNQQKSFFMYFPFYEVHVPLHVKKEWVDKFRLKPNPNGKYVPEFAAMLAYTDYCVGQIISKLKQLNVYDNTIILLMSDNGGQILTTSNEPLSGQKGNLTEGGIRVPFIAKWNEKIKPNTVQDIPVSIIDILPTLSSIAGMKCPDNIDGENLLPVFKGKNLKRTSLFWHLPAYNGNGKSNAMLWQAPAGVIRKGDWKLIQNFEDNSVQLYNLKNDIGEKNDLSIANPKLTKKLLLELENWQKKSNAPIPTELNSAFNNNSRNWIINTNQRNQKELESIIFIK